MLIALAFLPYALLIVYTVHELGHFIALKNEKDKTISEICFMGMNFEHKGHILDNGWVEYQGETTNNTFHKYWDMNFYELVKSK